MNTLSDKNSKLMKIHVSGLAIGMNVVELDKDWLESSFLYQGFIIQNTEDIRSLEAQCQYVWIEPVALTGSRHKHEPLHTLNNQPNQKTRYINKLSMTNEYEKSYDAFKSSRRKTKSILDQITFSDAINLKDVKETVEACLDSIVRNPNAMLWMSRIREAESYTADHSLNVCILCITFGRHLGFDKEELFALGICGLLHDVGKLRVPTSVLNKASRLSEKEWRVMQAHVTFGRNLLMSSPSMGQTVDVAYSHHERIDGKGYPRGLIGSQISVYTKIVSIVDSFDAMTAERRYSKATTSSAAVKEIYRCRGAQFDEKLALQFIEIVGMYPPGSVVELSNGCVGIVLERNQKFQRLPKVLLLQDAAGSDVKKEVIDLTRIEKGSLSRSFLIKADHLDGYKGVKVVDYQHFITSLN
jgi:HD-GYP domain-containing protein (c-di-GMP phosphodiesterase class II)